MLLDYFPKDKRPRDGQKKILEELDSAISSGHKKIIISAPTGIGKSHIAKTLADSQKSSFIVTSTKQLQDQYVKDFPKIPTIKGMSNFACFQLMDFEKVENPSDALRKKLTCEKGQCTIRKKGKKPDVCKYKIKPEKEKDKWCLYYKQKSNGLEAPQTILNYSLYFQMKKFQSKLDTLREITIFDEAHSIENEIVRFIGHEIWAGYLKETNVNHKDFDLSTVDGILTLLEMMENKYAEILTEMENKGRAGNAKEAQRYSQLVNRYKKTVDVYSLIDDEKENFVVQEPEMLNGEFRRVSVVPIDISKFADSFFDSEYQIFMSATIDNNNFAKSLGFNDCAFIDISKSPFKTENRKVEFHNVRYLSNRSSEDDKLAIVKKIDELLKHHKNDRGLILTSSIARCKFIVKNLSDESKSRIRLAHSENEGGRTINEILEEHGQNKDGVLLSSSLWQGIDLKDDLSRFQIIEKCPYLYLGDKRVEIKKEKDENWYYYQTTVKLLQGIGRSVRNENDFATTYVLDGAVQNLLKYNKKMVPISFHDVLYN